MLPSPATVLASATGAPVETGRESAESPIDIPSSGLHEIAASPDGETALEWIRSVVAPSRRRDAFIRTIEERKIPHVIPPSPEQTRSVRTHYISLDELQSRSCSLVEFFGLTERLVELGHKSRVTQCGACGERNPVFSSAGEILEQIAREWQGRSIRVELRGPDQAISSWGNERGFSTLTSSDGIATVLLDSFTCDDARCRQIQSVLATTQRLDGTWIEVRDSTDRKGYSWHGRCASCETQSPAFRRTLAREALERGDISLAPIEMSRIVGGAPLSDLVRLPIEEIAARPEMHDLWSTTQRVALTTLGVGSLSLMDRCSSIAPYALTQIPLVFHAGEEGGSGDLFIIDTPPGLLHADEERTVRDVGHLVAQRAPMVWLRSPQTEQPDLDTPTSSGRLLGTLSQHTSSTPSLDIRCGEWQTIHVLSRVANRRPAIAVSNVIEGVADATFSFSPSSPFSLHFIPLFSIESSLSRLVAHEIGAIEPLAKLFASSQQAKMLGLSPRELAIGQARHSASICGTCRGSGLVLAEAGELLSGASLCPSCWGSRFSAPARDVTFKGRTLWQLLNSTIHEATPVLQALPKMSHVLELLQLFDLTHIPLGVPTSLLPRTTRRLLSAARAAISATTNRPSLVVIEEPFVGLSAKQRSRLSQVASHSYTTGKVAWVGV
jgi:hypothetical protein